MLNNKEHFPKTLIIKLMIAYVKEKISVNVKFKSKFSLNFIMEEIFFNFPKYYTVTYNKLL